MPRRTLLPLALLAALAAGLAGCGGAPELTDPDEILAAAIEASQDTTAVRIEIGVDGAVPLTDGIPFELDGTKLTIDLDQEDEAARIAFEVPPLLGLNGEVLTTGGDAWVKTSLSGPQYFALDTAMGDDLPIGELPVDPGAIGNPDQLLTQLRELTQNPAVDPTKGEDVDCAAGRCYVVTIELGPDELAALGGADLPIDDLPGGVDLTVRVARDTQRLDGLDVTIDGGPTGSLTLKVTFTNWNQDPGVEPPPADQVSDADFLDFLDGFGFGF